MSNCLIIFADNLHIKESYVVPKNHPLSLVQRKKFKFRGAIEDMSSALEIIVSNTNLWMLSFILRSTRLLLLALTWFKQLGNSSNTGLPATAELACCFYCTVLTLFVLLGHIILCPIDSGNDR